MNFCTELNNWKVPHAVAALNIEKMGTPMSYSSVVTLFHEFGHLLHTLLSRTKYQHLSGVRCPTDFVETPSTLMENFLQDYNFVSLFARHWTRGEVFIGFTLFATLILIEIGDTTRIVPQAQYIPQFSLIAGIANIIAKGFI